MADFVLLLVPFGDFLGRGSRYVSGVWMDGWMTAVGGEDKLVLVSLVE